MKMMITDFPTCEVPAIEAAAAAALEAVALAAMARVADAMAFVAVGACVAVVGRATARVRVELWMEVAIAVSEEMYATHRECENG